MNTSMRACTVTAGALVLLAWQGSALGGMIFINSAQAQVSSVTGTVAQAKYRLSNTNWDQSLDRGTGTSSGNFISLGLGNNAQLSTRTYEFSLENRPGQGLVFTMTDQTTLASSVLSWGVFSTATGGTSVPTIASQSVPTNFNSLWIEARSTRTGSSLSFSGLSFAGSGLTLADGSFAAAVINPSVGGPGNAPGVYTQRLVSDTNLGAQAWTFRGLVSASRDSTSSSDESVKFTVGAQQVVATFVPSAGTGAGLALAAGLLAARRRRCVSRPAFG